MNPKKRNTILISCGVLLLVAVFCLIVIAVIGIGVSVFGIFGQSGSGEALAEPPYETEITAEPLETASVEDVLAGARTIESQVQDIRGLTATEDFERELISEADLAQTVKEEFFMDYSDEEAQQDAIVLSALGLLPPDFNLKQFYTDLYSEQIAGYYDDEIKTMFVVQGVGFGGAEKTTYAHEYTHVLQDQVYGFDSYLDLSEEACQVDSEKCTAIQALVEGDAVTTELLWFQNYASQQDYEDLMEVYKNEEYPVLDSAPSYIEADLMFPYMEGQTFVDSFTSEGGFERLAEVYANLPVSTEQILHPERYPEDTPVPVALPDLTDVLGEDWTLYDQNVMGEWYTYLILNQAYDSGWQLSDSKASAAAEGWGGDAYVIYLNEETDQVVFVLDTVWDTTADANEFARAFKTYARNRWDKADPVLPEHLSWAGVDGVVDFFQAGDRTVWVIAPDVSTAQSVVTELE